MKLKIIYILLGLLVLLFFLMRACVGEVKDIFKTAEGGDFTAKDANFQDIDYLSGNYAIILDDEEPAIIIDDTSVLEANKAKIDVNASWMTYLPGEGRWPYGIRLYKNNKLLHAILARKFKTFNIGQLRQHGKPLEFKSIYELREAYLRQKDSLSKMESVYFIRVTEVHPKGYEYRFILQCPSLLISDKDTLFNSHTYGQAYAQRIKAGLSNLNGFETGDNVSSGSMSPPILSINIDGSKRYLEGTSGGYSSLEGYTLYTASLIFFSTKESFEKIKDHDFSNYFLREGLSEDEIKSRIREEIGEDTEEIKLSEVYESSFGGFKVGERYESKYELRYFQLSENDSSSVLDTSKRKIILTENRDAYHKLLW